MLADAARAIGGEDVEVEALMGPGVDPHLYTSTRGDQKLLVSADVVIYHGLHLEGKMVTFLEELGARDSARDSSQRDGPRILAAAAAIPDDRLLRNELFGDYPDPHVWFDLELWQFVVREITKTLAEELPEKGEAVKSRGERHLAELAALDRSAKDLVARLPAERRHLVTSHDAFNYFGRAYGFEVRGLQGISTETQAGLKDLEEAIRYIRERRIPAVFGETSVRAAEIEQVAKKSGAKLSAKKLYSDALGDPNGPEGTLIGMFRYNLSTIIEELDAGRP
jgi:manganese/zinc/iron transport system substrate-binding protein